jgi:hypothetical protein
VVGLRLRTVASLRPRSRRYSQYRRFLRPCAAWFAAAQDITELGINHLERDEEQATVADYLNIRRSPQPRTAAALTRRIGPQ